MVIWWLWNRDVNERGRESTQMWCKKVALKWKKSRISGRKKTISHHWKNWLRMIAIKAHPYSDLRTWNVKRNIQVSRKRSRGEELGWLQTFLQPANPGNHQATPARFRVKWSETQELGAWPSSHWNIAESDKKEKQEVKCLSAISPWKQEMNQNKNLGMKMLG